MLMLDFLDCLDSLNGIVVGFCVFRVFWFLIYTFAF